MKFIVDTLYSINQRLKIHIRIGCPKLINGCNFGIDLYDDELLALKTDNFADYFKVESVIFIDIARLNNIFSKYVGVRGYGVNNCSMCFGNVHSSNNKTLE
jgi:glutamine phosphoribosylpyrophosphate amidotransferase